LKQKKGALFPLSAGNTTSPEFIKDNIDLSIVDNQLANPENITVLSCHNQEGLARIDRH
jgi:hypothetical protein